MRVLVVDDDEDVRQAIIDLATGCLDLKPEDIQHREAEHHNAL